MAITIKRGQRILSSGDSWSYGQEWFPAFAAWLNTQFIALPPSAHTIAGVATGQVAIATGTSGSCYPPTTVTVTGTGIPGNGMVALAGAAQTLIVNERPDVLIIASGGFNDARSATPLASFTTALTSVVNQARTANPQIQIAVMSTSFLGDKWASSPTRWDNPAYESATEESIDTQNAVSAATCTNLGVTFIDTRTQMLAWEVINNPTKAASEFLTTDRVHLNTTTGKNAIIPMVASYITIDQSWP